VLNLYDGISRASGQITDDIGLFTSTFAPVPSNQGEWFHALLDFFLVGFSLAAGPYWNLCEYSPSVVY
jgi:hypothetical protein